MRSSPLSTPFKIVLVGGGHTHVQVMQALAKESLAKTAPEIAVTLVTDRDETPYSGMLPGHVAGFYTREAMHIDLAALARATGTELVRSPAVGVDLEGHRVQLADGPPLAYDALSLDIGITSDLSAIAGAERFGLPIKPIAGFLARFDALIARMQQHDGPRRIAVVGQGAGGVEIAFALRARLDAQAPGWGLQASAFGVTLVGGSGLLPASNAGVRRRVQAALARAGIASVGGFRVAAIDGTGLTAIDGRHLPADAVLISTAARAPSWLAETGLRLADDGSVLTRPTLQTLHDPSVFAVGDCAMVADDPRPKAGVFAVRQAPTLARNLIASARRQPLIAHRAQRDYLTLLMTGDGSAIAGRGRWLALEGRAIWLWKDWIDRRFMQRFT